MFMGPQISKPAWLSGSLHERFQGPSPALQGPSAVRLYTVWFDLFQGMFRLYSRPYSKLSPAIFQTFYQICSRQCLGFFPGHFLSFPFLFLLLPSSNFYPIPYRRKRVETVRSILSLPFSPFLTLLSSYLSLYSMVVPTCYRWNWWGEVVSWLVQLRSPPPNPLSIQLLEWIFSEPNSLKRTLSPKGRVYCQSHIWLGVIWEKSYEVI